VAVGAVQRTFHKQEFSNEPIFIVFFNRTKTQQKTFIAVRLDQKEKPNQNT
jgi:hypothetical protein